MSEKKLFSIGDVARLFHISVSSLRHYENVGLLAPEYTDPSSGYRYYSAEHNMTITGFSREITLIDYGITNDTRKFVTEISIPVEVNSGSFKQA